MRMKARDFDPRILEIFDGYVHGNITKREFISEAGKYAAAGVTGANAGWPAHEAAPIEHQKQFSVHFYPEVNHGFHNDTTPRYDKSAATLAWDRTLNFFENHLRR